MLYQEIKDKKKIPESSPGYAPVEHSSCMILLQNELVLAG